MLCAFGPTLLVSYTTPFIHFHAISAKEGTPVSGASAYDEDTWQRVRLEPGTSGLYNSIDVDISCRTTRCKLPNVDPETGERHPVQPDKALRSLRNVDPGAPKTGCLGVQACPLFDQGLAEEDREGWIGVGMELQVQERGEHFYL